MRLGFRPKTNIILFSASRVTDWRDFTGILFFCLYNGNIPVCNLREIKIFVVTTTACCTLDCHSTLKLLFTLTLTLYFISLKIYSFRYESIICWRQWLGRWWICLNRIIPLTNFNAQYFIH